MDTIQRSLVSVCKVAWRFVRTSYGFWVLVVFLMWCLTPPGVLVTIPSPQHVKTTNPKVGVHTRLTDEVEDWKIQKTLAAVREMGASWIVEYFPWAYIEVEQDQFSWDHSDVVIQHARNQGLTIIARLGMVPAWARPDEDEIETTFTYLDEAHFDDFARFVAAFLERYGAEVQHIIIWNEPNLSFEWGFRPVNPEAYTDLLKMVYPVAHQEKEDVIVLAGALAPTLEPVGSPSGLNDLIYLEEMYAAGAAAYFDALAAHTYGLVFPPEYPPDPATLNFRRVELLRDIMIQYGDGGKQIYITETGWNDHPRWVWAVSPSERMRYTIDAYQWAKVNWSWCPTVAVWMFRTPIWLHHYQDYYALMTPDFQPFPIYSAVKAYTGNAEY